MRILITGAGGFAGRHLIKLLLEQNIQQAPDLMIIGTVYGQGIRLDHEGLEYHTIDLTDYNAVEALLQKSQPDYIYHLAAQSSPSRSRQSPWATLEGNIHMQFNILHACLTLPKRPRILVISSADIYCGVAPTEMPINEYTSFQPTTAYSVSKVTQDMMGLQYFLEHQLPVIRARPFNHIGRGQSVSFVAPDFAMQIARIEVNKQAPIIEVGNLAAERDFTDVRDIVRAYTLLMDRGIVGEAYNIASGKAYSINYMLETLLNYTSVPIEVRVQPDRLRPIDVPIIVGDYQKLQSITGWQPIYSFEDTLHDVLDDCRQRVLNNQE